MNEQFNVYVHEIALKSFDYLNNHCEQDKALILYQQIEKDFPIEEKLKISYPFAILY